MSHETNIHSAGTSWYCASFAGRITTAAQRAIKGCQLLIYLFTTSQSVEIYLSEGNRKAQLPNICFAEQAFAAPLAPGTY